MLYGNGGNGGTSTTVGMAPAAGSTVAAVTD
ncbi:hypothetical protein [Mycobacterium tuberculosis]